MAEEPQKEPINMSHDELKFEVKYPCRVHPTYKKMTCNICLKTFLVRNKWNHEKTQYHKIHERLNSKLRKLIMDGN
jgi:hypothetical protein